MSLQEEDKHFSHFLVISRSYQASLFVDEKYIVLIITTSNIFEKEPPSNLFVRPQSRRSGKRVQLPSEKYPKASIMEQDIELQSPPDCPFCGESMEDSGMTENSEQLTLVPKKFFIIRQKRHKYRCAHCHGCTKTAPTPPRINAKSFYSDEMMLDVSLSKYYDLISVERYSAMAESRGLQGIPPQSLIDLTYHVSDFVKGAYEQLKGEIQSSQVLHSDEASHKMLERNEKKNEGKIWYLWGFSNLKASFFDIHNTRSGDVSSKVLKTSRCEYLVSDVLSGYHKTVKQVNDEYRKPKDLPLMRNVYCNASARRKFKDAIVANKEFSDEARYFVDIYKKIYRLEKCAKGRPSNRMLRVRGFMELLFEQMKTKAMDMEQVGGYSSKSSIGKAISYFLSNYEGLTLFLKNSDLPIDNNAQKKQLRSSMMERKTWYGTQSKKEAQTASILFSLVESCKLNQVNPREYFKHLVKDLHGGKKPYTPYQYKKCKSSRVPVIQKTAIPVQN